MTRNRDWLVLTVRHQDTLVLPARLAWESVEAYAPSETIVERKGDSRSRRPKRKPLAPGFVFVLAEYLHKMLALHDNRPSHIPEFRFMAGMDGQPGYCSHRHLEPLRDEEAEAVRRGKLNLPAKQVRQWASGELVTYPIDALAGLVGTVERQKGKSVWVRFGPLVFEAPAAMLLEPEQREMAA